MLLSIGDQVAPGVYAVHSRFKRAVNFVNRDRLAFLVHESIGAGPLNIVFANDTWPAVHDVCQLQVEDRAVVLGTQRFAFDEKRRYDSHLQITEFCPDRFGWNLDVLQKSLSDAAPVNSLAFLLDPRRVVSGSAFERSLMAHAADSVRAIFRGDLLEGVAMLKGCGQGLTPAGDDFIAGMLLALNVVQQVERQDLSATLDAVRYAALGNNIFSNTFFDMARSGLVFEPMKNLICAMLHSDEEAVRTCALRLFLHGETSGADLATGFLMTLRNREAVRHFSDAPQAVVA